MMADTIPVWIDCDPGHDDAFALLVAATHPRLRLIGVSTVHGNASLGAVTANARAVLDLAGRRDVPVFAGFAAPLEGARSDGAQRFHGASGLAGVTLLAQPSRADAEALDGAGYAGDPCVAAMAAGLLREPRGTPWLVALGPLTNVAALLQRQPNVAAHVRGVSVMGGAAGGDFAVAGGRERKRWLGKDGDRGSGLRTVEFPSRWAEFNVWADAHAAAKVFADSALAGKLCCVALDLTHQVLATPDVFEQLFGGKTGTVRAVFRQVLEHSRKTYGGYYDHLPGPPLHDPLALAVVLEAVEDLGFDGAEMWDVSVVTEGEQVGRTVVTEAKGEGVRLPRDVDQDAFWRLIERALDTADARDRAT